MKSHTIIIAGAGGIGRAAALILANQPNYTFNIYIGDINEDACKAAIDFIGKTDSNVDYFIMSKAEPSSKENDIYTKGEIILDCLPGALAPKMAQLAKDNSMHYANLTEYVKETDMVTEIAQGANTGFVLQTGLAPGFINVLAMKLFNDFTSKHKVEKVDEIKMRVGALSKHAEAPHFYAFTWSPIGVATEYIKDALVVRDYIKSDIPSLSKREEILIDEERYEDNYTSGGAADLPEALQGKVKDLDYKTLRHLGHYDWVKSVISRIDDQSQTIQVLEETMLKEIPIVEDDVVIVYASVRGSDYKGDHRAIAKSYKIYPSKVGGKILRAIQSTTAGPLCQVALMLLSGKYQGPVFQSQLDPDTFLSGDIVENIYGPF